MNQERIGKFIKLTRKEKDLTQEELASKLRLSNRTISKWENGVCLPDYGVMKDLCEILDISINEFFSGERFENDNSQEKFEEDIMKTIKENNRIKKIIKIVIVVLCGVMVTGYFGYKAYLIKKLNINYFQDQMNNIKEINFIHDEIKNNVEGNIVYNDKDHEEEYKQDNISYKIPEGYTLTKNIDDGAEQFCDTYVKKDKEGIEGSIKICGEYGAHINVDLESGILDYKDLERLLNKYNIHNIVDLIKYYENNRTVNIFSSIDKIKMQGVIAENNIINAISPAINVHTLSGNLYGYYIELDDTQENKENYKKEYGEEYQEMFSIGKLYVTNTKINNFLNIEYTFENKSVEDDKKALDSFIHSIRFDEEKNK